MFYEGSLQEGISTAVDQQKLVLCFVTDDSDESKVWENDFLKDESLDKLLSEQSVALRLVAGSEESGYLAQIVPLPQTPTIVIIKAGELKAYITSGATKEDFIERVQTAFNATSHQPSSSSLSSSSGSGTTTTAAAISAQPASSAQAPPPPPSQPAAEAAVSPQTSAQPTEEPERPDSVRRILAERAARLEAQRKEAERKAKEEKAKAREKAKAAADAGGDAGNADGAARSNQQAEVLKRRQQEREERQRILKRIEADKAERRMRAAEREQRRGSEQKSSDVIATEKKAPSKPKATDMTALQVRLFDGSTIRSRFKTTSPLQDVRTWVDANRTEDVKSPYNFKQVLTPLPNKNIDATEESKTLGNLGLSPSSTLVLVPVQNYVTAYQGGGGGGNLLERLIALILGFFKWIGSFFTTATTGDPPREPVERPAPSTDVSREGSRASSRARQRRIHGFESTNDRLSDQQQLYNGNSLNFEPRPDEDDK